MQSFDGKLLQLTTWCTQMSQQLAARPVAVTKVHDSVLAQVGYYCVCYFSTICFRVLRVIACLYCHGCACFVLYSFCLCVVCQPLYANLMISDIPCFAALACLYLCLRVSLYASLSVCLSVCLSYILTNDNYKNHQLQSKKIIQ